LVAWGESLPYCIQGGRGCMNDQLLRYKLWSLLINEFRFAYPITLIITYWSSDERCRWWENEQSTFIFKNQDILILEIWSNDSKHMSIFSFPLHYCGISMIEIIPSNYTVLPVGHMNFGQYVYIHKCMISTIRRIGDDSRLLRGSINSATDL
jgi:hypothetical protein